MSVGGGRRCRAVFGGVEAMRESETCLKPFFEFLLRGRLVKEQAAPHCVRWVRRFLQRAASNEPLADQARPFAEDLEREGRPPEWQVRQAEQAVKMHFVNFLQRTDWHRPAATGTVHPEPGVLRAPVPLSRGAGGRRGGRQPGPPSQARQLPPGRAERSGDGGAAVGPAWHGAADGAPTTATACGSPSAANCA